MSTMATLQESFEFVLSQFGVEAILVLREKLLAREVQGDLTTKCIIGTLARVGYSGDRIAFWVVHDEWSRGQQDLAGVCETFALDNLSMPSSGYDVAARELVGMIDNHLRSREEHNEQSV